MLQSMGPFLAVWNRIIEPVAAMRKEANMLRLSPEYLKGEELFGLFSLNVRAVSMEPPEGCPPA